MRYLIVAHNGRGKSASVEVTARTLPNALANYGKRAEYKAGFTRIQSCNLVAA